MDLGFKRAGHEIIWANDIDSNACETYERLLGLRPICLNIRDIREFPKADMVIGCTPCQGFSIYGKRSPRDGRNYLYHEFTRCLRRVKAKYFIAENVSGLKSLYQGKFFKLMLSCLNRAGYKLYSELLDAKDYGVPQERKRLFIIGIRKDINKQFQFPEKTHGSGLKPYVNLKQAIWDMGSPREGEYCPNRFSPWYMSRNRRRLWSEVSFTIQASHIHIPLHPSSPPLRKVTRDKWVFTAERRKYKRLSWRHCARIQTFPASSRFEGSLEYKCMQIGNAVPPLLARRIAEFW